MAGELQYRASDGALLYHSADGTLMAECCCEATCTICTEGNCGDDQPNASVVINGDCGDWDEPCQEAGDTYVWDDFAVPPTCLWTWALDHSGDLVPYSWLLLITCDAGTVGMALWRWNNVLSEWVAEFAADFDEGDVTCNSTTHHLEGEYELAANGVACTTCTATVTLSP